MIIDFTSTAQNSQNEIEFFNIRGQIVRTYQLSQLEKFVEDNELNITTDLDSEGGTGMVSDPNTNFTEKEVYQNMTDYLDNNWAKVTEDFYNAMNPTVFKATNKPQQTKEAV